MHSDIVHQLTDLLGDLFLVDTASEVNPEASIFVSGMLDSISLLEVVGRIEKHWNIKFSWSDINLDNLDSIQKMANFIVHKQIK